MKTSAGILPYRKKEKPEVYLGRMGGPWWRHRQRAWSIFKGEVREGEAPLQAARREFSEETGQRIDGAFIPLGSVKSGGKEIFVWAVEAEPPTQIRSNLFTIEWPPHSGKRASFPEMERAGWFDLEEAREMIVASQLPFLDRLEALLA